MNWTLARITFTVYLLCSSLSNLVLLLLLQVLRRYHKFAGCRRSRGRGQAALSGHPVEGVEGLHEVSLGDGRLLAEHRRADELAVALVGPVLLGQLDPGRVEEVVEGEALLGVHGEEAAHQLLGRGTHVPPRPQVVLQSRLYVRHSAYRIDIQYY